MRTLTPRRQILARITGPGPDPAPRDRILGVAADCFYLYGVRAVGIERLIREADVAKATFYDHYRSKSELVVAYLRAWDIGWRLWFYETLQERATMPLDQIFAMFDVLADLFADGEYRGCAFARAITDVGDEDGRVGEIAQQHKAALLAHVASIASESGLARPDALATELVLLMEGAIVTAARERNPSSAHLAQAIARTLVESRRHLGA